MADDIIRRAKEALGSYKPTGTEHALSGHAPAGLPDVVRTVCAREGSLDVYLVFDTTGSMDKYRGVVEDNLGTVTDALLDGKSDVRISMNGVGDHCDGENVLQMYGLSSKPDEVKGALKSIQGTHGGDEPEAYECAAVVLTKRLPTESAGRKRVVVFVADSVPHGMSDAPCPMQIDYKQAFTALKILCNGFYFVGCDPQMYSHQKKLIDENSPKEKFIPLGDMVDVLPALLVAVAKRTQSDHALADYLKMLNGGDSGKGEKIRRLLGSGK